MPTVEATITLTIPSGGMSLRDLEECVYREVRQAAQALLTQAWRAMESDTLARQAARLRPEKQRCLELLTRFGWLRLERWHAQDRKTGRYSYPLDQVLRLQPRRHASPWVVDQAVALATRLPYRQATEVLCGMLGDAHIVDHRSLYAWVQAEGQAWVEGLGAGRILEIDETGLSFRSTPISSRLRSNWSNCPQLMETSPQQRGLWLGPS